MSVVENDVLNRLFVELHEALRKLKDLSALSEKELLEQYEKIDAAKYNFIVAIEAVIDICNRIIARDKLGFPQDYSDVMKVMGEKRIFDDDLAKRLVEMVKFRNLLVHLYWKIEDERLYEYLRKNLGDFEEFTARIREYLKRNR